MIIIPAGNLSIIHPSIITVINIDTIAMRRVTGSFSV
jgi:hypothetical protein